MNPTDFTYSEILIPTSSGVIQLHALHAKGKDRETARIYTDTQTDAIRVCDLLNGVGNTERIINLLRK